MRKRKLINTLLIFIFIFCSFSGIVQANIVDDNESSNETSNTENNLNLTNEAAIEENDAPDIQEMFNTDGYIESENDITIEEFLKQYGNSDVNPSQAPIRDGLPSAFDLRDKININVEAQTGTGLCWIFATLGALRTHIALKQGEGTETPNLSEWHMNFLTSKYCGKGFNRESEKGGNFNYAIRYFKNNDGPVLEEDCPFKTDIDVNDPNEIKRLDDMKPAYYVHKMILFPEIKKIVQEDGTLKITNNNKEISDTELEKVREIIKRNIMENGGLFCSIRVNKVFVGGNLGEPYNTLEGKWSQYDDGSIPDSECGGHAITIIGWDDNYSRLNFNAKNKDGEIVHPKEDGAYLVLNSWGENLLDGGYQWISYEDSKVEAAVGGYVNVDKKEKIYEYTISKQSTYDLIKEKFGTYVLESDDNTKTIKMVDLVMNDENIDLSGLELTDRDLKKLLKYGLMNVKTLNLSNNEITDITVLNKLIRLEKLLLKNNYIEDVTPILSLNNLTFLNISNNKLEEIPNLNKLSNLETLYLTQNSIRDFSLLDSTKYKYINIKGQKISDISSNKITKLSYPPIFLNAKEKSNFMYSNSKFEFIGCEESDDGTGIVLDKDIQVANVRIKTGKLRDTVWTINIVNSDKKPILVEEPKYYYDDKEYVYVLITADEPIKINDKKSAHEWFYCDDEEKAKMYGTTVTAPEKKCRIVLKYKKEDNNRPIKEEIEIINNTDNATIVNIEADTFSPKLTVNIGLDGTSSRNIIVTIEADEDITLLSGENWEMSNSRTLKKVYTQSTSDTIIVEDKYGNKATQAINVKVENNNVQENENVLKNEEDIDRNEEESINDTNTNTKNVNNTNNDKNLAIYKLPQTGDESIIYITILGVMMIIAIVWKFTR